MQATVTQESENCIFLHSYDIDLDETNHDVVAVVFGWPRCKALVTDTYYVHMTLMFVVHRGDQ